MGKNVKPELKSPNLSLDLLLSQLPWCPEFLSYIDGENTRLNSPTYFLLAEGKNDGLSGQFYGSRNNCRSQKIGLVQQVESGVKYYNFTAQTVPKEGEQDSSTVYLPALITPYSIGLERDGKSGKSILSGSPFPLIGLRRL